MLQKMLNQEEKMLEILSRFQLQEEGSSTSIPNFLPPKVSLFSLILFLIHTYIHACKHIYIYMEAAYYSIVEFVRISRRDWVLP